MGRRGKLVWLIRVIEKKNTWSLILIMKFKKTRLKFNTTAVESSEVYGNKIYSLTFQKVNNGFGGKRPPNFFTFFFAYIMKEKLLLFPPTTKPKTLGNWLLFFCGFRLSRHAGCG
ncbi:MAG: hypothetical protein CM15mP83_4960 [Flavobacteriaceae bacterium]|nr:MAG: hypothetical protein CM15mP83_4960 [Flavobacteriaceae bacterium]